MLASRRPGARTMPSLTAGSDHARRVWWKVRMVDSTNWMIRFEAPPHWYDARKEALRILRTKGLYDVTATQVVVERMEALDGKVS